MTNSAHASDIVPARLKPLSRASVSTAESKCGSIEMSTRTLFLRAGAAGWAERIGAGADASPLAGSAVCAARIVAFRS
ncbi:hypothetical protein [Burkholderia thailandensis]|uniref:hypothetical protein n=1 Tax=Burkholderia thailandensis TaxID=57975 RepID=UPI0012D31647|nr:hypothetical protein [Burkholderia thailandensis]MCS3394677.1 hypothetical protein [Burkholderia thailandensis]MCS6429054.1 hypothetical protein [Burkholderia thailandensis]MCS6456117.1 hypothetical protein [Burkholderia thailandensis]MCS6467152.1 hypothetical protein [Burkholderia thailandensis]MCS6485708.1 hypothetical protein [Burkholderia thailandensis]